MSKTRSKFGPGVLALPIACCVGLPLIAAVAASIGLAAWAGGIALALVAVLAVLLVRPRRQRNDRILRTRS